MWPIGALRIKPAYWTRAGMNGQRASRDAGRASRWEQETAMDLLTPTGRALAGLAVALVGIGALAGYAGIVGLGLAIGALVAAGWRSVRRASDLEVTRSVLPERARRGQVARVHIA